MDSNTADTNAASVRLGENCMVDAGVVLGYNPSRGNGGMLVIGDGARIRYGTIIYRGAQIGAGLETGHNVIIREDNKIGRELRIWSNSVIDYGCVLGNRVKIHTSVYVAQFTTIEDDVFMAPGVMIANDMHPGCPDSSKCMRGPTIRRGAQIGINCTILPRVVIGEHSVIGSGSVVTHDIPDGVVAYGNPARVVCKAGDLTCSTGMRERPYFGLEERV
jgi:acetyltransferase-like isoleucine patch superfamily enzyme